MRFQVKYILLAPLEACDNSRVSTPLGPKLNLAALRPALIMRLTIANPESL